MRYRFFRPVCCKLVSVKWSIASLMSSKFEPMLPMIWLRVLVTLAYMKRRTDVRTYVVRTDVHDVMAIKPNFVTLMGYHIFLTMVLRARAPSRAELRYYIETIKRRGHRACFRAKAFVSSVIPTRVHTH